MTGSVRTAVVTGAAQGVGEAAALRLARESFGRFLLVDRQAEPLARVADWLRQGGAEVAALTLDLVQVDALVSEIGAEARRLGRVDALVNAAGTTARGGLADTTPQTFDFIFDLNVRAPFFLMQAVAPAMPRGSAIVNICSMLAYGGPPFLVPYAASKAALVALTKGVANTLKRDGVRVFGVNLGWTWTPGEQDVQTRVHGLAEDWAEKLGPLQPFGRLLMPDDPAGLVAFLVSQDAAMMTGAIIDLDQYVAGAVDDNPGA